MKWEYKTTDIDRFENKYHLESLGNDGWELVGILVGKVYLKRPKRNIKLERFLHSLKYKLKMWFNPSFRKRIRELERQFR